MQKVDKRVISPGPSVCFASKSDQISNVLKTAIGLCGFAALPQKNTCQMLCQSPLSTWHAACQEDCKIPCQLRHVRNGCQRALWKSLNIVELWILTELWLWHSVVWGSLSVTAPGAAKSPTKSKTKKPETRNNRSGTLSRFLRPPEGLTTTCCVNRWLK